VRFECLVQHHSASAHSKSAKVARFLIATGENERRVRMFVTWRANAEVRIVCNMRICGQPLQFSMPEPECCQKNTTIARHIRQP
jgi:hypothetical protein